MSVCRPVNNVISPVFFPAVLADQESGLKE